MLAFSSNFRTIMISDPFIYPISNLSSYAHNFPCFFYFPGTKGTKGDGTKGDVPFLSGNVSAIEFNGGDKRGP